MTLSRKEAAARAKQRLRALEKEALDGAVVLDKQESISFREGRCRLRAEYQVEEQISVQSEIFVNEGTE